MARKIADGRSSRGRVKGCWRCGKPTRKAVSVRLTNLPQTSYKGVKQKGRSFCAKCANEVFDAAVEVIEHDA